MTSPTRELLLETLVELYEGPAWHGPSVLDALKGLDHAGAAARPGRGRPSAWETVLHLAYSRYVLMRRVNPAFRERFPRRLRKNWWPEAHGRGAAAWSADLRLLADYQARLVETIRKTSARRLHDRRPGKRRTLGEEVLGNAFHDAYHAGQLRLARMMTGDR